MLLTTVVLAASLAVGQATSVQPITPVLDKRFLLFGGGGPPSGMNCATQSGLLNLSLLSSANCNMSAGGPGGPGAGGFPGAPMNCATQSGGLLNLNLLSSASCNMASGGGPPGPPVGGPPGPPIGGPPMGGPPGPPMGGVGFGFGGSPYGYWPDASVEVSISSDPGDGFWAKSADHPKNGKHQA